MTANAYHDVESITPVVGTKKTLGITPHDKKLLGWCSLLEPNAGLYLNIDNTYSIRQTKQLLYFDSLLFYKENTNYKI